MQTEDDFSILLTRFGTRNAKIYIYNLKFDDVLLVVPEKVSDSPKWHKLTCPFHATSRFLINDNFVRIHGTTCNFQSRIASGHQNTVQLYSSFENLEFFARRCIGQSAFFDRELYKEPYRVSILSIL